MFSWYQWNNSSSLVLSNFYFSWIRELTTPHCCGIKVSFWRLHNPLNLVSSISKKSVLIGLSSSLVVLSSWFISLNAREYTSLYVLIFQDLDLKIEQFLFCIESKRWNVKVWKDISLKSFCVRYLLYDVKLKKDKRIYCESKKKKNHKIRSFFGSFPKVKKKNIYSKEEKEYQILLFICAYFATFFLCIFE